MLDAGTPLCWYRCRHGVYSAEQAELRLHDEATRGRLPEVPPAIRPALTSSTSQTAGRLLVGTPKGRKPTGSGLPHGAYPVTDETSETIPADGRIRFDARRPRFVIPEYFNACLQQVEFAFLSVLLHEWSARSHSMIGS